MVEGTQRARGEFIRVKCPDCQNVQVVFSKAATDVTCLVCGATMARATGGKAKVRGEVVGTTTAQTDDARPGVGGTW